MSLRITRLELRDFRSYEHLVLEPDPGLTLLVGPNAAGKTNVIEAVRLLTAAQSFRRPSWGELVRWGQTEARLSLKAEGEGRQVEVDLVVSPEGTKKYSVNGKPKRRTSEVAGILPSVVFTPDDLRMVKDAAERRRAALDAVGEQLSPSYARLKNEYEKTLRQRNAFLKTEQTDPGLFRSLSEQLAEVGSRFQEARVRLFSRMAKATVEAHGPLVEDETLALSYVRSWERDGAPDTTPATPEGFLRVLSEREVEEKARRLTLVGPHRDDIGFSIDGRDARAFASQGQQRTIALAWKLAEVSVATEFAGQPPVLLLDDVMSELDARRRHALTELVGRSAQTVITTTNLGYFEKSMTSRAKVVELGG